jgi:hypothetical protein
MNLVFSFLEKYIFTYKLKNRGQNLIFNKMTCEKMEDMTEIFYLKILNFKCELD